MKIGIVAIVAGMFLGGLIGGSHSGLAGVIWGGCFGFILFAINRLQEQLKRMQHEVEQLRRSLEATPERKQAVAGPQPPPEPAAADKSDTEIIDLVDTVEEYQFSYDEKPEPTAAASPASMPTRSQAAPSVARQPDLAGNPFTEWLGRLVSGENLLVKVGVVVLFIGVSFFVKFAAQHGFLPIELRLAGAAMGGVVLLAVGWRLRQIRPIYAQVIQGGGIGILNLTIFAAMRLYHLIPTSAGFALLVVICALTCLLAILQDSPALAVLGAAGGFLAPELASIGSGNHIELFSYYAVLNSGIIAIAWFRAWRGLNLVGFISTFIVSASWGSRFYQPDYFATVEPFIILYFLMYTVVAILFSQRHQAETKGYLDGTLVFGTPIVAFALQAGVVQRFEYGLAWSAFALGLFYIPLAAILFRKSIVTLRLLCESFLAFGVVFTTLAIPLAFDGRWTAAIWSVEGAAIVWMGLRQGRPLARGLAYLVLIGSGVEFLVEVGRPTGEWPVLNGFYMGCLLLSSAALITAYLLHRHSEKLASWEAGMELFLFVWGLAWWYGSGFHEIERHVPDSFSLGGYLAFIAVSCGFCQYLRHLLDWPRLDWPALGLTPAMMVWAGYLVQTGAEHPFAQGGYLAWPVAFVITGVILHAHDEEQATFLDYLHAATLWLLAGICAWEIFWQVNDHLPGMETWAKCVLGGVPVLLALPIIRKGEKISWPVARRYASYLGLGCGPLLICAWFWSIAVNVTDAGNPWPLPFLPFLNPLDAVTLLVLITLAAWYLKVKSVHDSSDLHDPVTNLVAGSPHGALPALFAATVFLWLNAVLLRSIHYWGGVPFTGQALFSSMLVQAAISIFWSLLSLVIMTFATRRSLRPAWIAGMGLLCVVVVKLFLIDLANHGTIERIISFVVVGILLLVIGWFAPVPPRKEQEGKI